MPETEERPMPEADTPATEIVRRTETAAPVLAHRAEIMSDDEIRRTWRTAAALAASRMFKDAEQAEQAFAKILIGRDLGISPTQALMAVDLVEGSIQLRGVLLARFLREHPTYDYRMPPGHPTDTECTVVIERKREGEWSDVGEWTFTVADAEKAGLIKADKPKAAWNTHRRNMLMWRAIANATRAHAPDVFGGVPVYVEGEIPRPTDLTAGSGDGQPQGLDLGPDVEKVLVRAAELGHAGLADRATAEMALGRRSPGDVVAWCAAAHRELDELEAQQGPTVDGEAVEDGADAGPTAAPETQPEAPAGDTSPEAPAAADGDSEPLDVEREREEVRALMDEADAADAEGDDERAEGLRGEALARAERLPPEQVDGQTELGL